MSLPLSILDLAPLVQGQRSADAIRQSVELAQRAEALGFERIWYAEHHSLPGVASTAPDLMIAHIAARTEHIRLGAGGVMLPNHAALRIAEAYRLLEAMHPGRIDLGLGRAAGTDQRTALALRGPHGVARDDFPEQVAELRGWGANRSPHPGVTAQPDDVRLPPIWLLGSSDYSANLAAQLGLPFAYAAHFSPAPPDPPMLAYRSRFRSSADPVTGEPTRPRSILAVAAYCAETAEEAEDLARPALVAFVRLRTGRPMRPPTPEQAREVAFTPMEQAVAAHVAATHIKGTPETVAARIWALAERTQADEVMLATHAEHEGRMRSLELLKAVWPG